MSRLIEILREDIELEILSPAASLAGLSQVTHWLGDLVDQQPTWSLRILRGEPALVIALSHITMVLRIMIESEKISKLVLHPVRQHSLILA